MQLSVDELRLILGKWASEETRLICVGKLEGLAFRFAGTLISLTDGGFTLDSGDARLVVFRLDSPELEFEYTEWRDIPDVELPEDLASLKGLAIIFPARIPLTLPLPDVPPERERVIISELRP
jgi:hypothetical protein